MKQEATRNETDRVVSRSRGSIPLACVLALSSWLLAGCTASWRAPVEARGESPVVASRPQSSPVRAQVSLSAQDYRVGRGDTLYGIAWQRGIDYRLLAAWNGIRSPYRIYPGQVLRLRAPAATRVPPASAALRAPPRQVPPAKSQPQSPPPAARPQHKPVPPAAPLPARAAVERKAPMPVAPASNRALAWAWPAQGKVVSSFRPSDPSRQGVRIAGRQGNGIHSAEAGKVVYAGSGLIGYGRLIIVKHNDKFLSAYGHNRKILVNEGDQVTKGQKIAEMGAANNGDPLLHFEIRRDGKPVDPLGMLPRR